VEAVERQDPRPATRILLTPAGRVFDQELARNWRRRTAVADAGHYEGFDERIVEA